MATVVAAAGCGKTSLLCALAGTLKGGELAGTLLFNGESLLLHATTLPHGPRPCYSLPGIEMAVPI